MRPFVVIAGICIPVPRKSARVPTAHGTHGTDVYQRRGIVRPSFPCSAASLPRSPTLPNICFCDSMAGLGAIRAYQTPVSTERLSVLVFRCMTKSLPRNQKSGKRTSWRWHRALNGTDCPPSRFGCFRHADDARLKHDDVNRTLVFWSDLLKALLEESRSNSEISPRASF
jgi:hypothetical protein